MQVVDTTDRAAVGQLITMREYVDVIVPRGGKGLIARLLAEARVPMIQHLDGNCHVYVDEGFQDVTGRASAMEESMLDFAENVEPNSRLSCQIRVSDDLDGLIVRLPQSQH